MHPWHRIQRSTITTIAACVLIATALLGSVLWILTLTPNKSSGLESHPVTLLNGGVSVENHGSDNGLAVAVHAGDDPSESPLFDVAGPLVFGSPSMPYSDVQGAVTVPSELGVITVTLARVDAATGRVQGVRSVGTMVVPLTEAVLVDAIDARYVLESDATGSVLLSICHTDGRNEVAHGALLHDTIHFTNGAKLTLQPLAWQDASGSVQALTVLSRSVSDADVVCAPR